MTCDGCNQECTLNKLTGVWMCYSENCPVQAAVKEYLSV